MSIRSTYMANLGRDYALDIPDLGPLAWLAQQHGTRLSIVLPPVSDAVPAWQQVYAPDVPWSSVRDALANEADAQGIRLLDYSDLLPSTTAWFRDPYHLTEAGQAAFMWSLFGKDGLPAD